MKAVAVVSLLVAMVSVQAGAALAKGLFPAIGASGAAGLRIALASAILCALFRPWRARLTRAQWATVIAYGTVLGGMNLVFYMAVARIPLGIAVAIEFAGPLAVAVLSSRRPVDFVWAGLAASGIVLFLPATASTSALDPLGVAYAAAAGVCWGAYILLGQRLGSVNAGIATSLGMVAGTVVVLPFAVAHAGARLVDPAILPMAVAVAVLSSAIPYTLEMKALAHMPAGTFGIFMSVEPALAVLAGFVMLGERLTPVQAAAVCCVILASAGSASKAAPRTEAAEVVA
jgi:inner membrane transporter RhtA